MGLCPKNTDAEDLRAIGAHGEGRRTGWEVEELPVTPVGDLRQRTGLAASWNFIYARSKSGLGVHYPEFEFWFIGLSGQGLPFLL